MARRLERPEEEYLYALVYRHVMGDETIAKVANDLKISRSKAHEVLKKAKAAGLIQTTVLLESDPQSELVNVVQAHWRSFGVREVIILPTSADDESLDRFDYQSYLRHSLGGLAAKYVATLDLEPGDHLALGGGRTCTSFAHRFSPKTRDVVIRPLATGGRWRPVAHTDSAAVVQILHSRLGYPPDEGVRVLCPEMPPGSVDDYNKRPEVRAVFGKESIRPAVTLCAIGLRHYKQTDREDGLGPDPKTSTYVQLYATTGYYLGKFDRWKHAPEELASDPGRIYRRLPDGVYSDANDELRERNIIGDVCRHGIDEAGDVVPTFLEESSLTISPQLLRAWRDEGTNTIVAAGGTQLAPVLRAALAGRFFRTVITDTAAAIQLIPRDKRPRAYRDIREVDTISE